MHSGRIAVRKHSDPAGKKARRDQSKLTFCLSTSVVNLSDPGSWKKHGEKMNGKAAFVFAETMNV